MISAEVKARALQLLRTQSTTTVHELTGVSMDTLRWWRFLADIKPVPHRRRAS